jgi:hypothetical protein
VDQGDHRQGGPQPYQPAFPATVDAAGPPPPPWERQRRTRRRILAVVVLAVLILAVPVAILVATGPLSPWGDEPVVAPSDDPDATEDGDPAPDADEREDPAPDVDPPPEDEDLVVPDLAGLEGDDAVFARLLVDIDESERAMIAFQDELQEAFQEHGGALDPSDLIERIREAAGEGASRLAVVRARLADPVDVEPAEAVRVVYVEHLDAWANYMGAVEDDPGMLGSEDERSRYILAINTSAGTFARTLEEELPADIAPEVEDFAEGILDRGFRIDFEPDA